MILFQLQMLWAYPHPLSIASVLFCLTITWMSFRLDVSICRQTPVRFNRIKKKVYWFVQPFGGNPVPKEPLKDNSIHYIRSLFTYMPWMMLNEWGRAARHDTFCRGWGARLLTHLLR